MRVPLKPPTHYTALVSPFFCEADSFWITLKMEIATSSETSLTVYRNILRHIQQDLNLHSITTLLMHLSSYWALNLTTLSLHVFTLCIVIQLFNVTQQNAPSLN